MQAYLCARYFCLRVANVVVVCRVRVVGDGVRRWGICSGRGGEVGFPLPVSLHKKGGEVVPSPFAANRVSTKRKKTEICGHTFVPAVPVYASPLSLSSCYVCA